MSEYRWTIESRVLAIAQLSMSPVFGFNTDIRYADTVYHVQTEAHEADLTVQTAIFVRGRCIEKQQTSYAQEAVAPGFSEAAIHQILTQQHKFAVNCIREGKLELLGTLTKESSSARSGGVAQPTAEAVPVAVPVSAASQTVATRTNDDILGVSTYADAWPEPTEEPAPVRKVEHHPAPAAPSELKLDWLSSDSAFKGDSVVLKYRLTLGSRGVEGAKLVARLEVSGVPSAYARTVTDCEGEAEVRLKVSPSAKASNAISITVQATHAGQSTARRFRLGKA